MWLVFHLILLHVAKKNKFQRPPGTWSLKWGVILDNALKLTALSLEKAWYISSGLWICSLVRIFFVFPVWFLYTIYQTTAIKVHCNIWNQPVNCVKYIYVICSAALHMCVLQQFCSGGKGPLEMSNAISMEHTGDSLFDTHFGPRC